MNVADFHDSPGVEDWRVLGNGLHCRYRCASLAEGATWAADVADDARASANVPTIDLRPTSVTIRIPPHWETEEFLDENDLELAQRIQASARGVGLAPDPDSLRQIQIAVAHAPGVEVQPFWRAVLGHVPLGDIDARDPEDRLPPTWFHEISGDAPGRGRTHIDVYVPADQAESIVAAAVEAGGRIADESHAPSWWTLASPDNHGVDIAPWPDRG